MVFLKALQKKGVIGGNLPLNLYYKILSYGAIEPPHFIAYMTAKVKPIFSSELHCNLSGEMQLTDNLAFEDFPEGDELNQEWFMFLLQNQY